MHLPAVAIIYLIYLANIIAETIEMLVKSTEFYPYFGCYTIINYLYHYINSSSHIVPSSEAQYSHKK